MTASGTERRGLLKEIGAAITNVAVPHHEPPAVVLCRRIVVVIVLVIGAALLGFSLSRTPGESSFYWLTFALAAVWTVGAKLTSDHSGGSPLCLYTTIDMPTEEGRDCDPPDPPDLPSQVNGHKFGGSDKNLVPRR
jgi:hypothetical protein